MIRSRRCYVLLVSGSVFLLAASLVIHAQCTTCQPDPWQEGPFEWAQSQLNPTTVGLPLGIAAPPIEGIDFIGHRTVVHIAVSGVRDEAIALLRLWAERDDLQVVVAFASVGLMQSAEILSALGERIVAFGPPESLRPVADYRVGEGVIAVTFLIDETGTIVYRFTRISLRWAGMIDQAVASFATTGEIPDDAPQEGVHWFEDVLRCPAPPLETLDGGPVTLSAGKPRLLLAGSCTESGQMAVVRKALDGLRVEFPHVEFILIANVYTDDLAANTWAYARSLGFSSTYPGFQRPCDDYVAESAEFRAAVVDSLTMCAESNMEGWTVLLDLDSRFEREMLLLVSPMIMIIDGDGRVAFPPTMFVGLSTDGSSPLQLHPEAVTELQTVLQTLDRP
ncbi:hypothetical protein JW848_06755 [Candidatus Bipolaricaulota bacterium]|nr:hypothetical protein [Candidatus Bipolaricaulota bacterium]